MRETRQDNILIACCSVARYHRVTVIQFFKFLAAECEEAQWHSGLHHLLGQRLDFRLGSVCVFACSHCAGWLFSRYSGFFSQFKDMQISLIAIPKLAVACVRPAID